ncbi:MAG: PAS-domain containing protein, partial [Rhodobacteraceae bacterium]|nr:PAS-domain containing protein [Paracoccaceae bacterium]
PSAGVGGGLGGWWGGWGAGVGVWRPPAATLDMLAGSRARAQAFARATSELFFQFDADRRFVDLEVADDGMLFQPRERFIGRTIEETLPETVARICAGAFDRVDQTGLPSHAAYSLQVEGRQRWYDLSVAPLESDTGGYVAVVRDATERREAEAALARLALDAAQARNRLVNAVEALPDGFAYYDAQDRLVLCNRRYREFYPRAAERMVPGARYEDILRFGISRGEIVDAIGREQEWISRRLEMRAQGFAELEQLVEGGRWLRVLEQRTHDGGTVGLRMDITALKQAEQRVREDHSAAMDVAFDGIALTDSQGRFVYMNRAHQALFGFSRDDEFLGRHWSILYTPAGARFMRDVAETQLERAGSWRGEVQGRRVDGSVLEQEVSLTARPDGGTICIIRNIAERRRDEAERGRLREQLQLAQRREAIGQLAAGLAHDFNNLLGTISGSVALIESGAPDTPAHLGRIRSAAGRAVELVARLAGPGQRERSLRRLDLRASLREAGDLLRVQVPVGTRLEIDVPDTPAEAMADPVDVLQVLLNLVINARDAVAGHEDGRIVLSLREAAPEDLMPPFQLGSPLPGNAYLCITVRDNGPGIPEEMRREVLLPYVSGKGGGGSGLGLAIVARLVGSNHAALRIGAAPGGGAEVTCLWPCVPPGAMHDDRERGAAVPPGMLRGRTVLLVDDDAGMLEVLSAFLEAAGAEVAPCTDPTDALAALAEDPGAWDLLMTDFDLGRYDGAAFAADARRLSPGLPVVLVTALPDWKSRAGEAGAATPFAAVVPKPVERQALLEVAARAIAARPQS